MKRWWLVMALMLSVGVNLGLVASWLMPTKQTPALTQNPITQEPSPQPDRPLPRIFVRMAAELGLEGESKEQFLGLQRRFLRRTIGARSQLHQAQAELRRELLAAEPQRQAVQAHLEQMAEARRELETAFAENVLDTRELLEPAQARRFLQMIGRLRQSRDQFRRGPGRSPFQPRRPGSRSPSR